MITVEYRKTYKSLDGKSYFTKKAAIKRSVIEKLKMKHGMDGCIDRLLGGEHHQTEYHSEVQYKYFVTVATRYARLFNKYIKGK